MSLLIITKVLAICLYASKPANSIPNCIYLSHIYYILFAMLLLMKMSGILIKSVYMPGIFIKNV